MLTILNGNLGSGKSLFLTILAKHTKKTIVANFTLKKIKYEQFDIYKFINGKYDNCIILLDEVYQYIEARNSMSSMNQLFSYMLFQSRKKDLDLYIAAQLHASIDLRYRQLMDLFIKCEKDNKGFKYTLINPKNTLEYRISVIPYQKAEKYFNYYNTNEIIMETKKDERIKYMNNEDKLTFLEEESVKFVDKYIKFFQKNINEEKLPNKPKRNDIKTYCLENNISDKFVSLLYSYIDSKWSKLKQDWKD